jgi:hypothetical protein
MATCRVREARFPGEHQCAPVVCCSVPPSTARLLPARALPRCCTTLSRRRRGWDGDAVAEGSLRLREPLRGGNDRGGADRPVSPDKGDRGARDGSLTHSILAPPPPRFSERIDTRVRAPFDSAGGGPIFANAAGATTGPRALPPPHYVCNRCNTPGHFITEWLVALTELLLLIHMHSIISLSSLAPLAHPVQSLSPWSSPCCGATRILGGRGIEREASGRVAAAAGPRTGRCRRSRLEQQFPFWKR